MSNLAADRMDGLPILGGLFPRLRRVLADWSVPELFGPDGWMLTNLVKRQTLIITAAPADDGTEYIHASIAGDVMPSYDDLVLLHRAAFGDTYAYQVFTPRARHVNIHQHALHLWGRADGKPVLPEFGSEGTI